jgi:hypothetical protein
MSDVGDEGLAGSHGQTLTVVDLTKPSVEALAEA